MFQSVSRAVRGPVERTHLRDGAVLERERRVQRPRDAHQGPNHKSIQWKGVHEKQTAFLYRRHQVWTIVFLTFSITRDYHTIHSKSLFETAPPHTYKKKKERKQENKKGRKKES